MGSYTAFGFGMFGVSGSGIFGELPCDAALLS